MSAFTTFSEMFEHTGCKSLAKPPQQRVILGSFSEGAFFKDKDGDSVFLGPREDICFTCFADFKTDIFDVKPCGPEKAFKKCGNCSAVQHFVAVCENEGCGKLIHTISLGRDPAELMGAKIFCSENCEMGVELNGDGDFLLIDLATKQVAPAPACEVWMPPQLNAMGDEPEAEKLSFSAFCKERGVIGYMCPGEYQPRACRDGSSICVIPQDDRVLQRLPGHTYSKPRKGYVAVHVTSFNLSELHRMSRADNYSMLGASCAGKRPSGSLPVNRPAKKAKLT